MVRSFLFGEAVPAFTLTSDVHAPIERCFDLARSIDFHTESMKHTGERAVAGVTTGLIELGDTVTWRARHLGVRQQLTSRITVMDRPTRFVDEQVAGPFRRFRHEHRFHQLTPGLTRLTDEFEFESPIGPLGRLVNAVYLTEYMRSLLTGHQARLRQALESDAWHRFIADHPDHADHG